MTEPAPEEDSELIDFEWFIIADGERDIGYGNGNGDGNGNG
jgi:hypothetical protein